MQLSLALYAVFSFISTGFDETFPVYADSSKIYGKVSQFLFLFNLEFVKMIARFCGQTRTVARCRFLETKELFIFLY